MPPCIDVYVWVQPDEWPSVVGRFIDQYVNASDPGEPRFDAFVRTYILRAARHGDAEALADLRRDTEARSGFSLYLNARAHHQAIITITEERTLVLGLSVDDPLGDPATLRQAAALLDHLRQEVGATAGIAGTELPPPQSTSEWSGDALVQLRTGNL